MCYPPQFEIQAYFFFSFLFFEVSGQGKIAETHSQLDTRLAFVHLVVNLLHDRIGQGLLHLVELLGLLQIRLFEIELLADVFVVVRQLFLVVGIEVLELVCWQLAQAAAVRLQYGIAELLLHCVLVDVDSLEEAI